MHGWFLTPGIHYATGGSSQRNPSEMHSGHNLTDSSGFVVTLLVRGGGCSILVIGCPPRDWQDELESNAKITTGWRTIADRWSLEKTTCRGGYWLIMWLRFGTNYGIFLFSQRWNCCGSEYTLKQEQNIMTLSMYIQAAVPLYSQAICRESVSLRNVLH